jgi:uncharacterized protein YjbI with pentapeptide repeats
MAKLTRKEIKQIIDEAHRGGEDASLSGMDLSELDLTGIDLSEVNLFRADLTKANLDTANLTGSRLIGATLHQTMLHQAKLIRADLRKANASQAYCSGADFSMADLRAANLSGTNFSRADLIVANFSEANLSGADLEGANLNGADLSRANLTEANLGRTDLIGANLSEANLRGAILNGAGVAYTTFADVDLSQTKGLEAVWHQGPSTIGVDTLYRSRGRIPRVFLRGAGVPEDFIAYALTLFDQAIQFYSCFISYSSKDQNFAERLYADLQNKGVRCWFAPEDMKIGDKIKPAIDQAIRLRDKLLLIFSRNSINSDWVEREVETALEEEAKRKQVVLFPVRLDETVMETDQAWAADIRRARHIGDFSRWKDHHAYQQAFERLLRDLKAEGQVR